MRAVWSSVIRGPPKSPGFLCYVCRAENAHNDSCGCPAAARCFRNNRRQAPALFVHPSSHRRNSYFGPSPLRACGNNTAEPHIRSPLLAAAPKFLILEVIELYRVEPIFMAASCSQDVMRSARRVLARVGVPSREGWLLYVARRVRPPSSQLPLGFRLGSHSAKARSEAFAPAPLS
jgi:hypothetical protein